MASGPLVFLRASDILDRGIREGCRCCPPQPSTVVALSSPHLEDMARKKCAGKVGPINKAKGITGKYVRSTISICLVCSRRQMTALALIEARYPAGKYWGMVLYLDFDHQGAIYIRDH